MGRRQEDCLRCEFLHIFCPTSYALSKAQVTRDQPSRTQRVLTSRQSVSTATVLLCLSFDGLNVPFPSSILSFRQHLSIKSSVVDPVQRLGVPWWNAYPHSECLKQWPWETGLTNGGVTIGKDPRGEELLGFPQSHQQGEPDLQKLQLQTKERLCVPSLCKELRAHTHCLIHIHTFVMFSKSSTPLYERRKYDTVKISTHNF